MRNDGIDSLHPISSLREHIYDQFFIRSSPCSYFWVRSDLGIDIFDDVLNLPILAMQGNGTESQWIEDRDDVSLRSASDTNPKVRNVEIGELVHKFQNFLTREGHTGWLIGHSSRASMMIWTVA